jgi:hypothetical protein
MEETDMLGIIKVSLNKNTRPVSLVNVKNGNRKVSAKLLDYLESKYQLLPEDMSTLRVVSSNGSLGNLAACFIRVYNQEMSTRNGIHIGTYKDLDQRPNLILYSGYILENDFIYITKYGTNVVYHTS